MNEEDARPSPLRVDRRELLETFAGVVLLSALSATPVWAQGRPADITAWARDLVGLKEDLRTGRIDVLAWQVEVERLNGQVPVHELTTYLDVDALTRGFDYDSNLAEIANPVLPTDLVGDSGMSGWFIRVFAMRRGGAIIPHVHNNMVSAHLVISGGFHARTHDRVRDVEGAVLLSPTQDGVIGIGDVISMSDRRNNQHWLIAQHDRSMTFDVGIVGLPSSWAYGHAANSYNMIFVDPTAPPERDGTIVAPILNFDQARTKFAP